MGEVDKALEDAKKAYKASEHAQKAGLMQISFYKGEKIKAMKEIGLNSENHNYLRPLLVKTLKVY